ncbi:MAG TPA: heavy metal-associated domain-containing protein [Desulfobulbales bacterium]|nr:heavy metal-associated domain-containing protein [Desulfobulbales bacterium]
MNQNKKIIAALSALLLGILFAFQANSSTVQRSNFIVDNLSCTSCLATIEAELKTVPGTLGMAADLRSGRVTVDHLSTLDDEQIAATISKLGYPATVDWTATVPEQNTQKFAGQSSLGSGCSSGGCGGCGGSGGSGAGPTAWKAAPDEGTISRTTLQVSNLSCTSCLANIAAELSKLSETYGMQGYLNRGIVIVDHTDNLENSRIAAVITGLGYPARVLATNEVPAQKAYTSTPRAVSPGQAVRAGRGCNSKGPCNATSASWQKLYNRYFTQTDSNQ